MCLNWTKFGIIPGAAAQIRLNIRANHPHPITDAVKASISIIDVFDLCGLDITIYCAEIGADFNLLSIVWL